MSDRNPGSELAARGFSTRAIRAASRAPRVGQTPTSVPIHQTATFASGDADELGRVSADPHAGYSYSRISNPTTAALGSAYAELAGAEAGVALASGMGAIHATLASLLRAGDRVVAPIALYGSTRSQLLRAVIDALDIPELTASLGSVHTMVVHPPSTSHRQSSELELLEAGITPGLLRVSVGLEDLEDLQADFSAAFADARAAATGEAPAAATGEAPAAPRESASAVGVG